MRIALAIAIGLMPLLACGQTNEKTTRTLSMAKQEFNLVETSDLTFFNCSSTITEGKMKMFFRKYPEYSSQVQPVCIPNCYGNPDERYFVLVYESSGNFQIPTSIKQPPPQNVIDD